MPGVLEEQPGGLCVWSRVSEGGRGRRGGRVVQSLVGFGEDLGLYLEGGGSPGGLWAEEGREPESGAHRCSGCCGKQQAVGGKQQVTTLVQVGHDGEDQGDVHQRGKK